MAPILPVPQTAWNYTVVLRACPPEITPMERIEVVMRAATGMWEQHQARNAASTSVERIVRLCAALDLELKAAPASDVMLGGAYSRLQLWAWEQPELGGIIWLRDDLEPEMRRFAIAHELGHYALHRGEGISLHPACDQHEVNQRADPGDLRQEDHRVEEYTPRARRELEANIFAAELLAPRAEVRRSFAAGPGVDAAFLATTFGISRELAQRRLIDAVLAPTRPLADTGNPVPLRDWERAGANGPGRAD